MKLWQRFLLLALLSIITSAVIAQGETVPVPDLTGLTIPQAAAVLNEVNLRLGTEDVMDLADGNGLPAGTIGGQSVAADTEVEVGTAVDVRVLSSPNMFLLYDDNDLTLVNTTSNVADVTGLRFVAVEGSNPASFAATRWASNVRERRCLQIWSIARREGKNLPECEGIQFWFTTNDPGEHFWTGLNGVETFAVIEDGIERVTCPAATANSQDSPLRCDFYLSGASAGDDVTSFIYFVYTPSAFAIVNQTEDKWMPTDRTTIFNFNPAIENPGVSLIVGDPALFQNPEIVADITRLAPGQCIMLTSDQPDGTTAPQDCHLIAQRNLSSSVAFWLADFEIESATDAQRHTCPAATEGRPTICILPQ